MWIYLALFAAGYLGFCALLAHRYVFPGHSSDRPPPEFEVVVDPSRRIAYTLPRDFAEGTLSGERLVVFVHGYGGTPSDWLDHMAFFQEAGIPSASLHLRGHGQSPIAQGTFGRAEAGDLLALISKLRDRFPSHANPKTMVVGLSLGGAVAWHAAAAAPDQLHAVATEGAYPRFLPASERWLSQVIPGAANGLRPVFWFAEILSGTRAAQQNPVEDAKRWRRGPALVIQTELDTLVTHSDAKEMADAAQADLWVVPGLDHAAGSASPEYLPKLMELAKRMGKPQPGTLGQ